MSSALLQDLFSVIEKVSFQMKMMLDLEELGKKFDFSPG